MTERATPTEDAPEADDPSKEGATPAPSAAGGAAPPAGEALTPLASSPVDPSGPSDAPTPVPPAQTGSDGKPWKPSYVFLAVVSLVSLALDLGTKQWAKTRLNIAAGGHSMDVIHDHLRFAFARNPGGAFGLLQDEPESIRRPFFLGISVLAVAFIVSLYRKLTPQQWALKWGLPLVLGGALGNLIDRIQDRHVVDFIDYRADWVRWFYSLFSKYPQDHWPTFNIADIAIVAGVGLMAIDMFTPRRDGAEKKAAAGAGPSGGAGSTPAPKAVEAGHDGAASGPKPPAPAELDAAPKET